MIYHRHMEPCMPFPIGMCHWEGIYRLLAHNTVVFMMGFQLCLVTVPKIPWGRAPMASQRLHWLCCLTVIQRLGPSGDAQFAEHRTPVSLGMIQILQGVIILRWKGSRCCCVFAGVAVSGKHKMYPNPLIVSASREQGEVGLDEGLAC